jgi:hypothetical protein
MPFGLRHEGRFTASAPFCSSGHAHDTSQIDDAGSLTAWRVYECDDGTGSFTAFLPIVRGEHEGSGSWKLVEGPADTRSCEAKARTSARFSAATPTTSQRSPTGRDGRVSSTSTPILQRSRVSARAHKGVRHGYPRTRCALPSQRVMPHPSSTRSRLVPDRSRSGSRGSRRRRDRQQPLFASSRPEALGASVSPWPRRMCLATGRRPQRGRSSSPGSRVLAEMRPAGFEPAASGLEGRRSVH